MSTQNKTKQELIDVRVNVKIKLAAVWASFMFLYTYVDYFHFYMPGTLSQILKGEVFVFDISELFLMIAMVLVALPTVMIFLSVLLPAKVNRLTNIIVAIVLIPYMLFNLAGEAWNHMYFAAALEVLLLILIIRYAWKWPRIEE